MKTHKNSFAAALLDWHTSIDRELPWKSTNDPYKIWLSEIIMQQTRVAQGTPYYLKFVDAFPTITDLANAEESKVMKLWQGLGYYSRARNLHFTAQTVRDQFGGVFPRNYKDILALKGIGKYTAAAIASFAYGDEYPVVDGNVIRVISRYYGITSAVDSTPVVKEINALAVKLIKGSNPADYNQAIMDFGALMCAPKNPKCIRCPFNNECIAYWTGQVASIPYKAKKIKKRTRYFHYFYIADTHGNLLLNHRTQKDIWQSLYDFPMVENDKKDILTEVEIRQFVLEMVGESVTSMITPAKMYKHILSHQTIYGQFYKVEVKKISKDMQKYMPIEKSTMHTYAFPVLITNFLADEKEWTLF